MIDLPIVLDVGGIRPSIGSKEFLAGHPEHIGKGIEPKYGSDGAAGFYLFTPVPFRIVNGCPSIVIDFGIRTAIPVGKAILIMPRSGLGCKGMKLMNTVGLIDSDYRGTIRAEIVLDKFHPDAVSEMLFEAGDAIMQAVLVDIPSARFVPVKELPPTTRGEGGFGSTTIRDKNLDTMYKNGE